MSIEERDSTRATGLDKTAFSKEQDPQQVFLKEFLQGPYWELVKPIPTPNWILTGPLLFCSLAAILLFSRVIELGTAPLAWKISFDINIVAAVLLGAAGMWLIVSKAIKSPLILRNQNTISSIILLGLLVTFFALRVLDLGIFHYMLATFDFTIVVGFVCVAAIVALAFRGSKLALLVLAVFFLVWGFSVKGFGFVTLIDLFSNENGGRLLRSLTPPRWEYFSKVIDPLLLTVQTAIASTVIGIVVALPLSILAARNTTPHPIIYNITRFVINTIRSIPALVLALLFIPFVGLGPSAGILGLGIHSISVLTKLYAEAFESVKPQPLEALNAVGANGLKTFRWGVFPQAFPVVASYSIYNWESNGRDSTVVAFVGGGGIGFLLQANLALLDYENVSVVLIVLIVTVALLDRFSDFIRSKII